MSDKQSGSMMHQPPPQIPRDRAKQLAQARRQIGSGMTDGLNCRICGGPLWGDEGGKPTPEEVADQACVDCGAIIAALNWRKPLFSRLVRALAEQADRLTVFCEVTTKIQAGKPVIVEVLTKHKPRATP